MQQVAEVKHPYGSGEIGERTFADLLTPLIEPGFRLALAMLHDPQAAEDAVQEASFTAWRKLGGIKDRDRIRPWFLPRNARSAAPTCAAQWHGSAIKTGSWSSSTSTWTCRSRTWRLSPAALSRRRAQGSIARSAGCDRI